MGLADEVLSAITAQPGVFGFYARNLGTDEVVEVDADRVLRAESAITTCILVHYSRLVDSGSVDPSASVLLTDDSRFIGTGVLRYLARRCRTRALRPARRDAVRSLGRDMRASFSRSPSGLPKHGREGSGGQSEVRK